MHEYEPKPNYNWRSHLAWNSAISKLWPISVRYQCILDMLMGCLYHNIFDIFTIIYLRNARNLTRTTQPWHGFDDFYFSEESQRGAFQMPVTNETRINTLTKDFCTIDQQILNHNFRWVKLQPSSSNLLLLAGSQCLWHRCMPCHGAEEQCL